MDKINKFIDMIIDENALKPVDEAYSVEVQFINKHDLFTLFEMMFNEDTGLQDLVMCHLQEQIDKRIPHFESEDRYWRKSA